MHGDVTEANAHAVAFADGYPVAAGHTLVVPRRHVASVFDLPAEEYAALWALVAAGQTVGHAHVHVIPRRAGDVGDPRGGVRWVLPERAAYWVRRDG